ncbi:MAG: isoaspartyl peptidase/L-asparaginase family protein [Gammaproteobacteria bacterium]
MTIAILVHGGVGPHASETQRERGMAQAVQTGYDLLAQGKPALDAVEAAVAILEDDPTFNAGRGSVLTAAGTVETDAALMEGHTLRAGAVGSVSGIQNPIHLARAVLEDGRCVFLVGSGAERFAENHGIVRVDPATLITEPQKKDWLDHRGTVGAVACDASGHLAAATSTGGLRGKHPGRIGDSPVIGAGTYADRTVAVSCTGDGESILRALLAHRVAISYGMSLDPALAARASIDFFGLEVPGIAGLIMVDQGGRMGFASSPGTTMLHGRGDASGIHVGY